MLILGSGRFSLHCDTSQRSGGQISVRWDPDWNADAASGRELGFLFQTNAAKLPEKNKKNKKQTDVRFTVDLWMFIFIMYLFLSQTTLELLRGPVLKTPYFHLSGNFAVQRTCLQRWEGTEYNYFVTIP